MAYPSQLSSSPRTRSRAFRGWAHALTWTPVVVVVLGVAASVVLLVVADSSVDNAGYGYLALMIWGLLLLGAPLLLAAFVAGIVMLVQSRR